MKGLIGVMLITAGIFIAVLGGYLFNATDVTTCETEWEYVTDVGGAFVGDTSDMEVDYDPAANVTGWSYHDAYNNGRITGVDWKHTSATNTYRVTEGAFETVPYTMAVSADDSAGTSLAQTYTAQIAGAGSYTGDVPEGWGLYSTSYATVYTSEGVEHHGTFAMSMADLTAIIPDYTSLRMVTLTATSVSDGLPAFAAASTQTGRGEVTHNGIAYTVARVDALASVSVSSAVVNVTTGMVYLGGTTVSLADAFIVWGASQFEGTGTAVSTASFSLVGEIQAPYSYMDPASGVMPMSGTYTEYTMGFNQHSGSTEPAFYIDFANSDNRSVSGTISAVFAGSSSSVQIAEFTYVAYQMNYIVSITPTGGSETASSTTGQMSRMSMSSDGSSFAFYADGTSAGAVAYPTGYTTVDTIVISMAAESGIGSDGTVPEYTFQGTKDDGSVSVLTGGGEAEDTVTASFGYVTYEPVETTGTYDTVYWYNYDQEETVKANSEVTMAFIAPSRPASNTVMFRGPDGSTSVLVSCSDAGLWTVGAAVIGKWEGVQVTVGHGSVTVVPISSFRTFMDYDVVDSPIAIPGTAVGGGNIVSIRVSSTSSNLRMAVTSTVAFIPEGGLFLQNGTMNVNSAFPNEDAISVMLGSAAKIGDSITFSSSAESATLLVNPEKRLISLGGKWYPFNGIVFRWYSSTGDTASIDGQMFGPAIYRNGKEYESGAIWAETSKGAMAKVIEAPSNWSMTLDGVWAPSVFLYVGDNKAATTTQLDDITEGVFKWDKNQFLLVLMAVIVIGAVVTSYFKVMDLWDWVVVIGAAGTIYLILG